MGSGGGGGSSCGSFGVVVVVKSGRHGCVWLVGSGGSSIVLV